MEYAFSDYNRTRPYSSINYLPPEEFERLWMNDEGFMKQFLDNRRRKEVEGKCLIGSRKNCPKLKGSDQVRHTYNKKFLELGINPKVSMFVNSNPLRY